MSVKLFKTALQQKTDYPFKVEELSNGVYDLHVPGQALHIYYYQAGAMRVQPLGEQSVVHIDEDQWLNKPEILLNRLASSYGQAWRIHARETVVARIDKGMALEFQDEHHLHGAIAGKYRYGLFEQGELMAVAVFSGLRTMRHTEGYRSIELIHFCQKGQYVVRGGLSKLIDAMLRDFHPDDVMTYIDRDWSAGEKFEVLGFTAIEEMPPVAFLVDKLTHQRTRIPKNTRVLNSSSQFTVQNLGSVKMIKRIYP